MSEQQNILASTVELDTLNLSDYIVVSGNKVSNPVVTSTSPIIRELTPPPISSKIRRRGRPAGQTRPCQCTDCKNVSGAERHICHFTNCGKSFFKNCPLEAHLRNHIVAEPYQCPESGCGVRFVRANDLRKHTDKHNNSKYLCELCGKRYYREDHFNTHYEKCSETL